LAMALESRSAPMGSSELGSFQKSMICTWQSPRKNRKVWQEMKKNAMVCRRFVLLRLRTAEAGVAW
jgi:hypothetical protein